MLNIIQNSAPLLAVASDEHHGQQDRQPGLDAKRTVGKPMRFVLTGLGLVLLDCAMLSGGYGLMLSLWPDTSGEFSGQFMLLLSATYLAFALQGGGFSPVLAAEPGRSVTHAWLALLVISALAAVSAIFATISPSTITALARAIACAAIMIGLGRVGMGYILSSEQWRRFGMMRTIILNDGQSVVLPKSAGLVIDTRLNALRPDANDPAAMTRLGALTRNAERVVVACPAERRSAWVAALRGANVPVDILVDEIDHLAPVGARSFGGRSALVVTIEPLTLAQRTLKRGFDVTVALAGVVALFPLLLGTALAVKLDSSGPVLFRQPRVGRGNKLFDMYKFRSMRTEVQDINGSQLTQGRGDHRVTRVGRFIRATSIDELPQLLNVLRGEMSIVGPRPHALGAKAGTKLYWEVDPTYWDRHAVKPGLTGLAQVRGYRGTTFADADLENRLSADLEYLQRWSLASDIGIVMRTVMALTGKSVF